MTRLLKAPLGYISDPIAIAKKAMACWGPARPRGATTKT